MWPLRSHRPEPATSITGVAQVLAIVGTSRDQSTIADFAKNAGWDVTVVGAVHQGLAVAAQQNPAVIVLDRDLVETDWRSTIRSLAGAARPPCIILASSVMDEYLFDEIVKQGGFDMVAKPIRPAELRQVANLALAYWKSRSGQMSSE